MPSLPASALAASTKKQNTTTGEEGAVPSVTIMQASAKVRKTQRGQKSSNMLWMEAKRAEKKMLRMLELMIPPNNGWVV